MARATHILDLVASDVARRILALADTERQLEPPDLQGSERARWFESRLRPQTAAVDANIWDSAVQVTV